MTERVFLSRTRIPESSSFTEPEPEHRSDSVGGKLNTRKMPNTALYSFQQFDCRRYGSLNVQNGAVAYCDSSY